MFIIEVGELVKDKQGSKFSLELNEKCEIEFDENYTPNSKITGKINLMKIADGINVHAEDLKLDFEFSCAKCNSKYTKTVHVPTAERVFYFEEQKDLDDIHDIFYVDMKNMQIANRRLEKVKKQSFQF